MRLKFQRNYTHDRGAKGGAILFNRGHVYDVSEEIAAVVTEGDDPIAHDPDNPPPEPKPVTGSIPHTKPEPAPPLEGEPVNPDGTIELEPPPAEIPTADTPEE